MSVEPRDTTDEAREVQIAAYRAMTPSQRVEIALQLSDDVRALSRGGIRRRHPELDERGVHHEFLRIRYGPELAAELIAASAHDQAEFLAAIVARLDSAEIPHMIAGSIASSHHGEPRSTQAIDLVVDRVVSDPSASSSSGVRWPTKISTRLTTSLFSPRERPSAMRSARDYPASSSNRP